MRRRCCWRRYWRMSWAGLGRGRGATGSGRGSREWRGMPGGRGRGAVRECCGRGQVCGTSSAQRAVSSRTNPNFLSLSFARVCSAPATQNTLLVQYIYAKTTAPRPPITRIKKTQQVRSPNILLRPSLSCPIPGQAKSMSDPIAWHQPQPQPQGIWRKRNTRPSAARATAPSRTPARPSEACSHGARMPPRGASCQ